MVIAGGGTGGHLFPGLAVARALDREPGLRPFFLGGRHGIEARVLPRSGFRFELLAVRGLRGEGLRGLFRLLRQGPSALGRAVSLLRRERPLLVVGLGGYAAMPGLAAAVLMRVPIVLLEQNAEPGLVTRLFAPFARRICVSFEETRGRLGRRAVWTGNPVRLPAMAPPPPPAVAPLGLLVFGGSAGARRLNEVVPEAVAASGQAFDVLHQTGERDREAVAERYRRRGIEAAVVGFIDDMAAAYARSDLVICRAGATTVAELAAFGRPSVLVPYPRAAGDHQRRNAEALVSAGAAWMVLDRELEPASLAELLRGAASDPARLRTMGERARRVGRPEATERVVAECLAVLGGGR